MESTLLLFLLSFLVTFQMIFIGFFLVTHRKGKRLSNALLGTTFLLIGWNIGNMAYQISPFYTDLGFFQFIDDGFLVVFGPLMYLYTKTIIYKEYKVSKLYWIHFIPYIIITTLILMAYKINTNDIANFVTTSPPLSMQVVSFIMYLHPLIYVGIAYKEVRKYQLIIKNEFSKIDDINLNWLSFMLQTFGILTILALVNNGLLISGNYFIYSLVLLSLLIFMIYFVNRVILKALRQPEIFAGIEKDEAKYAGSTVDSDRINNYRDKVEKAIEEEKLYQDPQLTLGELAAKLDIPPKTLSQVINQSFNKSFFDYINSMRIRDAQRILIENQDEKLTVLEIMYSVGFNSKSSFNTAFKKYTGSTPTQFRRKS